LKISAAGVDKLSSALPKCWIEWDGGVIEPTVDVTEAAAWERSLAAMQAEEQVKAVAARLKKLNPSFDGQVSSKIKNGLVTEIGLGRNVFNISPLKGMPLTHLDLGSSEVQDLSPLRGMPLTILNLHGSRLVRDLTPLKGMPLISLNIAGTQASDLSPLEGMNLASLDLHATPVSDLSPLKDLPLTILNISEGTQVRDLEPLKDMPLKTLHMFDVPGVTNLQPLQGMNLETLSMTPKNITEGLDVIRNMKSLKSIGTFYYDKVWPAAEFWERYDKGEFTK